MRPVWSAALAAAAVIGSAATASADSPVDTIGQLEAAGYTVNVDRVGSGPLDRCVVTSIRNPQTVTDWVPVWNGGAHSGRHGDDRDDVDYVQVVVSRSISVSLDCSG